MNSRDLASEWNWARGLTIDLLKASSPEDLSFRIDASCGPLWKQFRHVGRVHENYMTALETRRIEFGIQGCSYHGDASQESLVAYFECLAERHRSLLKNLDPAVTIDWFGKSASLSTHLTRLLTHETLHHGQLIIYRRAAGKEFPDSWSAWGE